MKVTARFEWDPALKLEDAKHVDAYLIVENGEKHEFHMAFNDGRKIDSYRSLILRGGGDGFVYRRGSPGFLEYTPSFIPEEFDPEKFLKYLADVHSRKYYIAPRNEHVTNEEYHAFYGSTGMIWDLSLCDYPTATSPERLIQTLYDMQHLSFDYYQWTNPHWKFFMEIFEDSVDAIKFYREKLAPILTRMKDNATRQDMIELVKTLQEIQEIREGCDFSSLFQ
jgi:hypothetical protein